MADVEVTVNDRPVEVPEECTVEELRRKAGLPDNRVLYDTETQKTLRDTERVQNAPGKRYGAIERWTVGA